VIFRILAVALWPLLAAHALASPTLENETPRDFKANTNGFDYLRRDIMIAMRDGVKLHTVIVIPRGATHAPILLTRTPYDASDATTMAHSPHLVMNLGGYDNNDQQSLGADYIRVVQDVRGKYKSEGDYVMNRPLHGRLNPTPVDDSTDAYDTIDWLAKHVPESNGRVGIMGISYDGFTTLMALIHPHPALKVAVPMNPMVDGWIGDDWFHRGAFRQLGSLEYIYEQESSRGGDNKWWSDHYDDWDNFMESVSADGLAQTHGLDQLGFYRKLKLHPAYDEFWQGQAVDKLLAREPLTVPTMLVHSLWDQEDIYGAIAVYKALKPKDKGEEKLFLTLGPWHHGQELGRDPMLGPIDFGADNGRYFRLNILRPFLDHYLKDSAPPMALAPVTAFETGTNKWRDLPAWPAGCAQGCNIARKKLYLLPDEKLAFTPATDTLAPPAQYVSDPAKPVPFIPRPVHLLVDDEGPTWTNWLASDQREAATRPDVLSFVSDPLTNPVKISGEPIADLVATTSGTDGDFVVKLIDVYPDEYPRDQKLGGYQLMISADIIRGRYRGDYAHPSAIPAGEKQTYRFGLPTANHVFLPGHRLMVQVQSSWYPLYDRNPQSYVPNIFTAKPSDYRPATIQITDAGPDESFLDLPVVQSPAVQQSVGQ
jgi:putative CocE/NonD family hydrolase